CHAWPNVCIGDNGRGSLKLSIFLRQFVRRRNKCVWQLLTHQFFYSDLVIWVPIGMQKQNRDGFDTALFQRSSQCAHASLVQILVNTAVSKEAFTYLKAG